MARGDRREEIFRDERDRWKFLGYLAEGAERLQGESALLCPDGESFSSGRDDAGGQPFQSGCIS